MTIDEQLQHAITNIKRSADDENTQKYRVYVDDVFDLYNTDRRYCDGEFNSYEEAVGHCKKIIDDFIKDYGKDPSSLAIAYAHHGESPFVLPADKNDSFSASKYFSEASERHFSNK